MSSSSQTREIRILAHTTETAIIEGSEFTIATGSKSQTVNVPESGDERRVYRAIYQSEQQNMWQTKLKLGKVSKELPISDHTSKHVASN